MYLLEATHVSTHEQAQHGAVQGRMPLGWQNNPAHPYTPVTMYRRDASHHVLPHEQAQSGALRPHANWPVGNPSTHIHTHAQAQHGALWLHATWTPGHTSTHTHMRNLSMVRCSVHANPAAHASITAAQSMGPVSNECLCPSAQTRPRCPKPILQTFSASLV